MRHRGRIEAAIQKVLPPAQNHAGACFVCRCCLSSRYASEPRSRRFCPLLKIMQGHALFVVVVCHRGMLLSRDPEGFDFVFYHWIESLQCRL